MVFGHRRLGGLKLRIILIQGGGEEPVEIVVLKTAPDSGLKHHGKYF